MNFHALLKHAAAVAATPSPARPIQGTTGNGPLANPVTISTTVGGNPINTGAGSGIIGSRLPQGGTTANPVPGQEQQPVDPADLDKANQDAQAAQAQAEQYKAQANMAKLEAAHHTKLLNTASHAGMGYVGQNMERLGSRMQKLLSRVSTANLTMPKLAVDSSAGPVAVTAPPAPKRTAGSLPVGANVAPRPAADYAQVRDANDKPLSLGTRIMNQVQDKDTGLIPMLEGQVPMNSQTVPMGPADFSITRPKDTTLPKWSGKWLVDRLGYYGRGATDLAGSVVADTVRGTGGGIMRGLYQAGKANHALYTDPVQSLKDLWDKPVTESKVLAPAWNSAKELGGVAFGLMPWGRVPMVGSLLQGAMSTYDDRSQAEQARQLAAEMQAQQQQVNPQAQVPEATGSSVLEWLTTMAQTLKPWLDTSWANPQGMPQAGSRPSEVGQRGHFVRNIDPYIR